MPSKLLKGSYHFIEHRNPEPTKQRISTKVFAL